MDGTAVDSRPANGASNAASRRAHARRAVGRILRLLAAVAVLMAVPVTSASAHAFLIGSDPADGSSLSAAPSEITLRFSESVVIEAFAVDLVGSTDRHFRPSATRLLEPATGSTDTEEPATVVISLPPLPRDAYRLQWQTFSSDDLHRTNGVLVFGIGQPVTRSALVEPAPRWDEVALRAAVFLCLGASVGGLLVRRIVRRAGLIGSIGTATACLKICRVGALGGLTCCALLLLGNLLADGASVGRLLEGSYGIRFGLRELGFLLLLLAATHGGNGRRTGLAGGGAVLVGTGSALLGHAGAGTHLAVTRVAADAAHLLAAATWSGGLLILLVFAVPAIRARRPSGIALLRGFGIPAGICVAVMVVTGLYLASSVIGSVDAALLTNYGRMLIVKIGIVCAIGVLGIVNHTRLRRRATPPVRTVAAEAFAAVAVLVLAAALTSAQPATEPQFITVPSPAAVPVMDAGAADLQETLAMGPNLPGTSVILLNIFDTRRPAPGPIREVLVSVGGRSTPAIDHGDGSWSLSVHLGDVRTVEVTVTVKRQNVADTVSSYQWVVGGSGTAPAAPALVSRSPLGGTLVTVSAIAGALALVAGAALWLSARRRRGQRGEVGKEESLDAADLPEAAPVERERSDVPVAGGR